MFIAAMAFVPCTLTIEGHGSLLPEERHKIYAPVAGIVGEVLVDHDARVQKGDILVKLDSHELAERAEGPDGREAESREPDGRPSTLQAQKLRSRPGRAGAAPDPGPAGRGEDHGQELQGADRDRRGTDRVDEHPFAAGRDHHDLGSQART